MHDRIASEPYIVIANERCKISGNATPYVTLAVAQSANCSTTHFQKEKEGNQIIQCVTNGKTNYHPPHVDINRRNKGHQSENPRRNFKDVISFTERPSQLFRLRRFPIFSLLRFRLRCLAVDPVAASPARHCFRRLAKDPHHPFDAQLRRRSRLPIGPRIHQLPSREEVIELDIFD